MSNLKELDNDIKAINLTFSDGGNSITMNLEDVGRTSKYVKRRTDKDDGWELYPTTGNNCDDPFNISESESDSCKFWTLSTKPKPGEQSNSQLWKYNCSFLSQTGDKTRSCVLAPGSDGPPGITFTPVNQ